MSCTIRTVENHKEGEFHVDVKLAHMNRRFESMMDAQKWIELMKKSGDIESIYVTIRDIIITAKQQLLYTSCYVA